MARWMCFLCCGVSAFLACMDLYGDAVGFRLDKGALDAAPGAFGVVQLPDETDLHQHVLLSRSDAGVSHVAMDLLPGNVLASDVTAISPDAELFLLPSAGFPKQRLPDFPDAFHVDYDWSRFLARIENDDVDAFILKDFGSYPTVLHETGFRIHDRKQYIYGWWNAATVRVDGVMRSMTGIDFVYNATAAPFEARAGAVTQALEMTASVVAQPEAVVATEYLFVKGVPGLRITRRFSSAKETTAPWGPDGYWMGGPSSWFPTHQRGLPDAHYVAGAWHEESPSADSALTQSGDLPLAVLYWESSGVWLAMFLDSDSITGAFDAPRFMFAFEDRGAPGWHERLSEPFREGAFSAWYLVGQGSKEEAAAEARHWFDALTRPPEARLTPLDADTAQALVDALTMPSQEDAESAATRAADSAPPPPVVLENEFTQVVWDVQQGKLRGLAFDMAGAGRHDQAFLTDKQSGIYFTAGSQWQRSLDWRDTDYRYLLIETGTPQLEADALIIPDCVWRDPESNAPWLRGVLEIRLDEGAPGLSLMAHFEAKQEDRLPYLGWHFDFPLDSFHWVYANGWSHDVNRWSRYRMGIMDLQPMRPAVASDNMALYPNPPDSGYGLALEFAAATNTPLQACNMPNPLFDREAGIQKFAMTATETFWRLHNTRGMVHEPGRTHTLGVRLRPLPPEAYAPLSYNTPRIELPHAPTLEAQLDHFWIQHCQGGPAGIHGVASWWWTLASRFSPRLAMNVWRNNLTELLAHRSDGETVVVDGWTVPEGAIPTRPHDFNWNNGYLFDNNGQFIHAAETYYLLSGDREFLERHSAELEAVVQFYLNLLDEDDGIVLPAHFDGIAQNRATLFWDGAQIGHKPAHVHLYAITACRALARLLREIGMTEQAANYDAWADRIKARFVALFWRAENLHDNQGDPIPGGRYAGWITADQYRIDPGYTDLNLMAAYFGETPAQGADAILTWIDADPHSYAWRDSETGAPVGVIVQNTIDGNSLAVYADEVGPLRAYSGPFNPFSSPAGMQNGQVMLFVAGFDWYVRARQGEGAEAVRKMLQFLQRYGRGDLTSGHGVPESRPLPMFQGTSQMSPEDLPCGSDQALAEDGAIFGLGILSGIFGLEATYAGLAVQPYLTEPLADAKIRNLRYLDRGFTLAFEGYGDSVRSIQVNGELQDSSRIIFPFDPEAMASLPEVIQVVVTLDD